MYLAKVILLTLLLAISAQAQLGNTTTLIGSGAPTGSCYMIQHYIDVTAGDFYFCPQGTWVNILDFNNGVVAKGTDSTNTALLICNTVFDPTCANSAALYVTNTGAFTIDPTSTNITTISNTLASSGFFNGHRYLTTTNCMSATGACADATAGCFTIPAAGTTRVVTTAAANLASTIILTRDDSKGGAAQLNLTCNTQSSLVLGTPRVTAITGGTNFTAAIDVGPTTNGMCVCYMIIN